jgi:hypothetical protein
MADAKIIAIDNQSHSLPSFFVCAFIIPFLDCLSRKKAVR